MKKIIVKESQLTRITENVIREQFSDDPNAFTTKVDDVNLVGLKDYFPEYKDRDFEIVDMDCYVKWRYDLEARNWGIKDISIYTTSVQLNAVIEIYDEDYTTVETTKEITLNVDDMGGFQSDEPDKWYYVDMQDDEMKLHSIFPSDIEVDLNDKTVNVIWN